MIIYKQTFGTPMGSLLSLSFLTCDGGFGRESVKFFIISDFYLL